jgi:SAM-dependent methyltransferase
MPELDATVLLADRLRIVFDRLGIARAHVMASMSADWGAFVVAHSDRICSFTVVAPHLNRGTPTGLRSLNHPCLVVSGDQGAPARRARDLAAMFARCDHVELGGYESIAWADTAADRTDEIAAAVETFFDRAEKEHGEPTVLDAEADGEAAGIRYRVRGRGPAVVLMPLSFAPSQWDPLADRLADRYAVVQLGGPHLGVIALLEGRAATGYGDMIAQLIGRSGIEPGETVLEVGCGSGALARGLAARTAGANPIVATDLNPYFLSEARALAEGQGLVGSIAFERANAESLPYADGRFDVVVCCTVLEEGDAERMLSEFARVARPGGRIVVVTRALDIDWWVNLALPPPLKRKVEALGPSTGSGVGAAGCADASLYARVRSAGLAPHAMGPQFAIYSEGDRLDDVLHRLAAALSGAEARKFGDAVAEARSEGVLFVAEPHHCVVAIR